MRTRICTAPRRLVARPELSIVAVVAAALLNAGCSADAETSSGITSAASGGAGGEGGGGGQGGAGGQGGGGGQGGEGGQGGAPVCQPGATEPCYSGPQGTEGVGVCVAGLLTCEADGSGYGPCVGEVTPTEESCATPANEDCLMTPDCGAHLWSKRFGDASGQNGQGLAVDPTTGDILLSGYFGGVVDFGGGPLTSAGGEDIVLVRLTSSGAHVWSKRFGGANNQRGQNVAFDAAGDIYISGWFAGALDLGGGALTSAGGDDTYVAKLTSSGDHVWSKRFGGAGDDHIKDIAVDAAGNASIVGDFPGTINFGGGNLTSAGLNDIFLAKLDASGDHAWSERFGDAADQLGGAVKVGPGGDVIITGAFNGSANFGGGSLTSAGSTDIYVAAFTGAGAHAWSKRFGDASEQRALGIDIDSDGAAYVTGDIQGTADFGGGALTSAGGRDHFLTKLDATGAHVFSKRLGGAGDQVGQAVAVDGAGNVFLTGYLEGTTDYGGGALTSAGLSDISLVKLDATGAHVWSARFGDAQGQSGQNVALDPAGGVYVFGDYTGAVDFGGGSLMSAGALDMFVAKLAP